VQESNNEKYIEGIRNHDNTVLKEIYDAFFASVQLFIRNNFGTEEDAKDVFQESIIIIYRKIKKNELALSCSFKTYLFSVCKYQWLKVVSKKDAEYMNDFYEIREDENIDGDLIETIEEHERYAVYQKHFEKLNEYCRQLLKLFMDNISLKKIAEILGYSSENVAKQRKYVCKENLIKSIQNDPKYKDLL